jgi:hypothetical protein
MPASNGRGSRRDAASRLRIVVTGLIAQYPLGGVAWDYGQYAAGLARLGHDVYYLEDTGQWPYNPREGGVSATCDFNVEYLRAAMRRFGLDDRWAYRFPHGDQWFGLTPSRREEVLRTADVLVNVSGSLADPGTYRHIPRLVYIDSDPVFTQVKVARDPVYFARLIDLHDVHFSFGERLSGRFDSGHDWRPTRQPILLSEWRPDRPRRDAFTTVMNWTSYKPVVHDGKEYGQKNVEFMRFIDLPSAVAPAVLELAVNAGKIESTPRDLLARKGWRLADPGVVCPEAGSYQAYIESSAAEWTVAKHGYVAGRSGWFSCRSACYLAAGRPVVVQDTGFSDVLPAGEGIVPFTTPEEAAEGIRSVRRDYDRHSRAARELAAEYFAAERVLPRLLEDALVATPAR